MVSNAEFRRIEREDRRKRRGRAAAVAGLGTAIALQLLPKDPLWVGSALVVVAGFFLYGLFLTWVIEVQKTTKRITRSIVGVVAVSFAVGVYGWFVWPPHHRHPLNAEERTSFEKPLKDFKHPQMSIQLYCAPNDEVDCEYAATLIPLFGEGGWNVSTVVNRITLARPEAGIVIGLHGTVKPEDEPKLKWNQGEWTRDRPEEWAVRQAFVNIGIEPDSTSGAVVPENQINIYVGHERADESAPTLMTREFENLKRNGMIGQIQGEK